MGHRGCRLDVTYPEIGAADTRNIKAAININKKHRGWKLVPEIMVPLVGWKKELDYAAQIIRTTADEVIKEAGGSRIIRSEQWLRLPSCCVKCWWISIEQLNSSVSVQTTLTIDDIRFSRDDAGKFLDRHSKYIDNDPFAHGKWCW